MSREVVLALVEGSDIDPSKLFDADGNPNPKRQISILPQLSIDLPKEPVYKWSVKLSIWNRENGKVTVTQSENGLWLDLTRLIANTSFNDSATCEIITNYSKNTQGHFQYNPAYSSYKQEHYTGWMFKKRAEEVEAATVAKVSKDAISEYQDFIGDVRRGYCPVDIAIQRGKDITAKSLLQREGEDMSVCLGFTNGDLKKPCYLIKSMWLAKDVPVGESEIADKLFCHATKALADEGYVQLHSKLGVAINAGNLDIAKFILGLGYMPDKTDCEDIRTSFEVQRSVSFLNSLNEGVAPEIARQVLAAFHDVGVDPTIQVLGDTVAE